MWRDDFSALENFDRMGVEMTPGVYSYVKKEEKSFDCWFHLAKCKQLTNEHIMMGALSEMVFPFGTLVATPLVSRDVIMTSTIKEDSKRKEKIEKIKSRIQRHFMSQNDATFLVPIDISMHWGICIARVEEGHGKIYWGDSLNMSQLFIPCANALRDIMQRTLPKFSWNVTNSNYITNTLNYVAQEDSYSCGFYVISAAATFATSLGCVPGYGYVHGYDSDVTERIRHGAVVAFFKRVSEAYEKYEKSAPQGTIENKNRYLKRFNDWHVFQYVAIEKYGYVPRDDKQMLVIRKIVWDARDPRRGMEVQDLDKYIEILKTSGQKFQYRRTTNMKTRQGQAKSLAFTCSMIRKGCKSKLRIYSTKTGDVEKNTAVINGVHNHGLVFSSK